MTERELLHAERPHPPEGERKPSKAEQVEALIRDRCRDGEPHPSMYDELRERCATRDTHHRQRTRKKLCTHGATTPRQHERRLAVDAGGAERVRRRRCVCLVIPARAHARGLYDDGDVPVYLTP